MSTLPSRTLFARALLLGSLTFLAAACASDSSTATAEAPASEGVAQNEAENSAPQTDDAATGNDDADNDGVEHAEHDDGHDHEHGSDDGIEVSIDAPTPGVSINLIQSDEAPSIYNLAVTLSDFTIDADAIDGEPVDNTGHMHLLIDGVKIERFTELTRQVTVPEGEHLVEVELNANDHRAWTVNGEPIRAGATVVGAGEAPAADVVVNIQAVEGIVKRDLDDRVEVTLGDLVEIRVESDTEDEIHLHGYDVLIDVVAGEVSTLQFAANIPGTFEVELEDSGVFLVEFVVS